MREETKRAQTVIEGHDHRTLGCQVFAVIPGEAAGAASEAATVNPDHDGTTIVRVIGACPDVRIKAIFASRRLTWRSSLHRRGRLSGRRRGATTATAWRRRGACNAWRSERISLSHAFPFRNRQRRTPPVFAKRRRRKGDAFEDAHVRLASADDACKQARVD